MKENCATEAAIPQEWERDVLLAPLTSWKIGGPARYFFSPRHPAEAANAYAFAHREKIPLLVLGKGSNLLISDSGWPGLVLALSTHLQQIALHKREDGTFHLRAQAGALLTAVTTLAARAGARGIEKLAGIPGSIGGAVIMNAGAYGSEIGETLQEVVAVDHTGSLRSFSKEEMELGYRKSRFQTGEYLLLEVILELNEGDAHLLPLEIAELLKKRKSTQPLEYPSGGSLFKRPAGDYAGRLIEEAGLKGFRVGDAAISTKHAGFAINLGRATAKDVYQLSEEVIRRVKERSGITLEREQIFVGDFSPQKA